MQNDILNEDEIKLIEINENQHITDLYPNGLPTDTIIDKTITGCGATTCELESKRNSIIVEPNVPVIKGKEKKYPKALGVHEGITDGDVKSYLEDKTIRYKKIIVTPESYSKVKRGANYAGVNLFEEFFLLIDECEKLVQEVDFREDVILPFFDLFIYKSKCIISATPLYPSVKGFENHSFHKIKIVPTYNYKKNIIIIDTNNVKQECAIQIKSGNSKKAIFLNSIDYIKNLIRKANIKSCSKIYCSDQNDNNIRKLEQDGYKASEYFTSGEIMEQYSFFTSRFYSAVDLDTTDRPDIIMVTDCLSKLHTIIDPFTHAIQICGRFRSGIGTITHITNWKKDIISRTREEIFQEIENKKIVYDQLLPYRETLTGKDRDLLEELEQRIVGKFLFKSGKCKGNINPFIAECAVEVEKVNSFYKQLSALQEAYKDTKYFNVSYRYEPHEKETEKNRTQTKTLSRSRKLEILDRLRILIPKNKENKNLFLLPSDERTEELSSLKIEAPILCEYYNKFGMDRIIEINYNMSVMKHELNEEHKKNNFFIPIDEIHDSFTLLKQYSEEDIVAKLQAIYNKHKLVDDNNKSLIAKATFLSKYFVTSDRITMPNSRQKGYIPLEKKNELK